MLRVLCVESAEHSERAVVDGQIEDIEQTARIAGQVKSRMEQALGLTLTEVHVAAAGRVLKTEHVVCQMELDDQRPVGAKELAALESMAIQKAYQDLVSSLEEAGMKINNPDLAPFAEATASVLTDNAATYGDLLDKLAAWKANR